MSATAAGNRGSEEAISKIRSTSSGSNLARTGTGPDGVHAVHADTGVWKWRLKSNYPIRAGVTPTAGGLVFIGDGGGNFYALDAANGQRLWGQKIGGAIAGGVITYTANGLQKVAVATGFIRRFGQ